jgi:hypothetical protein
VGARDGRSRPEPRRRRRLRRDGPQSHDHPAGAEGYPPHCHAPRRSSSSSSKGRGTVMLGDERAEVRAGASSRGPRARGRALVPGRRRRPRLPGVRHPRAQRRRLLPAHRRDQVPRSRRSPSRRRALTSGPGRMFLGPWPSP